MKVSYNIITALFGCTLVHGLSIVNVRQADGINYKSISPATDEEVVEKRQADGINYKSISPATDEEVVEKRQADGINYKSISPATDEHGNKA